MALQTIVSREVNPAHPSVVTVGRFESGTAANVIAGHARLTGTIRAQQPEVRLDLERSIRRVATAVGALHNAAIDVDLKTGTPAVINPPEMADLSRRSAAAVVGADRLGAMESANMGAEDFGYYSAQRPASYVRFGTATPEREFFPAHSSRFDFDERVMGIASAYFHRLALAAGEALLSGILPNRAT